MPYRNNKGADLPAHLHSLISAFFVHCLDSIIGILAKSKISSLFLVYIAEPANLSLTGSKIPEDMFSCDVSLIILMHSTNETFLIA